MSSDREMDHLENMSNANGSRHWNQPAAYGGEPMIDPLNEALYRTWQHLEAKKVADEASQRLSRNTWNDLKLTAKAMGVEL